MEKSIHIVATIALVFGFHAAWADDTKAADKPGMGNMNDMQRGGMQGGEMKGMNMDKEHMQQMHEHMDAMHKSMDMNKGDATCADKSDGKCAAKDMKKDKPAKDDKAKGKEPADADDHSAHHP